MYPDATGKEGLASITLLDDKVDSLSILKKGSADARLWELKKPIGFRFPTFLLWWPRYTSFSKSWGAGS